MKMIDNEVIIKSSFLKNIRYIILFLVVETILFFDIFYVNIEITAIKAIIIITFILIALVLFLLIIKIIQNKPLLIIKEQGFIDHSTLLSIGFISWKEVDELYVKTQYLNHGRKNFIIGVRVKDTNKIIMTFSKIKAKLIKLNGDSIFISVFTSKYNYQEVLEIMQTYFSAYKENQINSIKKKGRNQSPHFKIV